MSLPARRSFVMVSSFGPSSFLIPSHAIRREAKVSFSVFFLKMSLFSENPLSTQDWPWGNNFQYLEYTLASHQCAQRGRHQVLVLLNSRQQILLCGTSASSIKALYCWRIISKQLGNSTFLDISCCSRLNHFETAESEFWAMYLGSRQVSCLTIAYCKVQRSNSLFLNFCNRTIRSFLNSNTWRGLAFFFASASCTIILQAKPTSISIGDKVFSLLRTSILESLAAALASSRTVFLIILLKSVQKIVNFVKVLFTWCITSLCKH